MDDLEIEPEVVEDERPHSSFSQLSTYIECSERWRLEKQVRPRLPRSPAPWFVLGLGVHTALENWEKSNRSIDVVEAFCEAFDAERASSLEKNPDLSTWTNPWKKGVLEVLDDHRETGIAQMQKFVEFINDPEHHWEVMRDGDDGSPWVEVPFDIDLGGVRVIGSIDAVAEDGHPVDYKTGKRKNSKQLQLGLYHAALKKQFDIDSSTGQFFYTKIDARSEWGLSNHYDVLRYTEEYVTELFTAAQRGIEAGVFLPSPGDHCGLCDVKDSCREMGWRPIPLDWESIPENERWWGSDAR